MLNRTNLTLSASNFGLNLVERSLVAQATFNVDRPALRARHAHPLPHVATAVRDGDLVGTRPISISSSPASSISMMGMSPSMSPISPPSTWRPTPDVTPGTKVVVVAEAPPMVGPVVPSGTGRDGRVGRAQAQGQDQPRDRRPDDRDALPKPMGRGCARAPKAARFTGESYPPVRFAERFAPVNARNAFDPVVARTRATGG
jgi:hypothetical protein